MDTKVYYMSDENENEVILEASKYIREGKLVVFPTETVYGLGANALDKKACERIFKAKGRPQDNPLIVHVANKDISEYVKNIPEYAEKLIDKFWPGPLTIILEKNSIIANEITGGLNSVAIRMPENVIARKIIEASKVPIAAPSANLSGKPSPTVIEHCIRDLSGRVDMIIGGYKCKYGLESTVVEIKDDEVIILRPGEITLNMIKDLNINVKLDPSLIKTSEDIVPKSPGMKYKHYAPDCDMIIVSGKTRNVIKYINDKSNDYIKRGKKVGIISTRENVKAYTQGEVLDIGSSENLNEIASKLFFILREFDKMKVDYIFSEGFTNEKIGLAIMNRLKKAANHKVINV